MCTGILVEAGGPYLTHRSCGCPAYTIENGNTLMSYVVSNGVFTPIGTPLGDYNSAQMLVDATGSFLYAPESCLSCAASPTSP